MREPHFLARNHSTSTPSSLLFLDVATQSAPSTIDPDVTIHQFRLGVSQYVRLENGQVRSEDICVHRERQGILDTIYRRCSIRRPLYVFVHDGAATAAIIGLWEEIISGNVGITKQRLARGEEQGVGADRGRSRRGAVCLDCPPFLIELYHEGCKIIILDISNYWRCSLEEIAQSVGVHIGETPTDNAPPAAWTGYVQSRVKAMQLAVTGLIAFIREHDLGQFSWTVAGQAMRAYRHRFMTLPIHIHSHSEALAIEREAYRGGQCELYYHGHTDTHLYHLDCRGLFPYEMANQWYPREANGYQVGVWGCDLLALPRDVQAVGLVRLTTRGNRYPVRHSGRIVYAEGTYQTYLAWPELIQAARAGEITYIGQLVTYLAGDLFSGFVEYFWNLRRKSIAEGDIATDVLSKLLMNGLYGKWAQRSTVWETDTDRSFPLLSGSVLRVNAQTKETQAYRMLAGECQRKTTEPEGYDSFPAIAASITSNARIHMNRLRNIAGERHVYHQYVDALIVDRVGLDRLTAAGSCIGDGLGQLRLIDESDGATFYGAGDYVWQGRHSITGIPVDAVDVGNGTYRYSEREGAGSTLERGPDGTTRSRRVVRTLRREPPAGIIGPDGWIEPVHLGE